MRFFHVSEEDDIRIFKPRIPSREDMYDEIGLVWAITEKCLPNFLTPRNCPRVTYHINETSTDEDNERYFSSKETKHVIAIESVWFKAMKDVTLYVYEFDPKNFYLQDKVAGYFVSKVEQIPINKLIISDAFSELFDRGIEVRILDNLWDLSENIKGSLLNWSLCRMDYAKACSQ